MMTVDFDWYDFMDAAVDALLGTNHTPILQLFKELDAAKNELGGEPWLIQED